MLDLPSHIDLRLAVRSRRDGPPPRTSLPATELERLDSFDSEVRRLAFALGRTTARGLLGERLGLAPREVPLVVADDGACEVAASRLHVSIAHTALGESIMAAVAIGDAPLGVDLEALKPRREDLYRRILTPSEYPLLEALSLPHQQAQIVLWSLKEAVLKAERCGFRVSPRDLALDLDPSCRAGAGQLREGRSWQLRWEAKEAYVVAVAFR